MPHLSDISAPSLVAVLIIAVVASFGWRIGGWLFDVILKAILNVGRKPA